MTIVSNIRGVVRGRVIELEQELALPDGQTVRLSVETEPAPPPVRSVDDQPGYGAWEQEGPELDDYLEWSRRQRKQSRGGTLP